MLPGMAGAIAGASSAGKTLLDIITDAGLLSNLVLCLDAGDLASYDGSSQTWTDVSGNSNNFYRGATSGSEASDPTFNGGAGMGSENEYFSLDGADYFLQTSASLAFAESWHKNSAAFTFGFVIYADNTDGDPFLTTPIFNNCANNAGLLTGTVVGIDNVDDLVLYVENGGSDALAKILVANFLTGTRRWICGIVAVNEAAGTGLMKYTSAAATALSGLAYTSPAAGDSSDSYSLMANSDGTRPFGAGSRVACIFAWNSVLTTGNLDTLYAALKLRFPTLA